MLHPNYPFSRISAIKYNFRFFFHIFKLMRRFSDVTITQVETRRKPALARPISIKYKRVEQLLYRKKIYQKKLDNQFFQINFAMVKSLKFIVVLSSTRLGRMTDRVLVNVLKIITEQGHTYTVMGKIYCNFKPLPVLVTSIFFRSNEQIFLTFLSKKEKNWNFPYFPWKCCTS